MRLFFHNFSGAIPEVSVHTSPMMSQFVTRVCDHKMTAITAAGDADHKHKSGATIYLKERCCFMRAPYGLNILDNCLTCPVREEHLFCNLSVHAGQRLNDIKSTAVYPKGAMLFIEGQQPRGVFVLCAGKAKLSTSSREGKTIITKLSDAGDVLGLNSVISDRPYEVTAEMMEPGQANFIPRESLLQFLKDHGEVALRVAEQLSRNYYTAYEEIRTLGLSTSPSEKFAKLLLSWSAKTPQSDGSMPVKLTLTHEEIAEIIGTTRETVSRLFSEFKKRQLLQLKGSTLVIRNRPALEKIVQS
jgi:CRP/FNR family cyclic AMP-dependent transcriptional regulator